MVKEGIHIPTMATVIQAQSIQLFFRTAERIPMGTPIPIANPKAQSPRIREFGKDCVMISITGLPLLVEMPNEPSVIIFFG